MSCGVYIIENILSQKVYVGSSQDIFLRFKQHESRLRRNVHQNTRLQHAWNKYGKQNFKFKILLECLPEHLLVQEQFFMDALKPWYNICPVAYSSRGRKDSDETKKKKSEAVLRIPVKAVVQLDISGNFLCRYTSAKEAAAAAGICAKSLQQSLAGRNFLAGGFRWKYEGEKEKGSNNWKKKIDQYFTKVPGLKTIATFSSIKEASEKTGILRSTISMCLAGKYKTAGGYGWRYSMEPSDKVYYPIRGI